jgi:hypothetical protein
VLARALAKKRDERYQTAADFAESLRPFGGAAALALPAIRVAGPQVVVERANAGDLTTTPQQRGGLGLLIGVAVACLVGGVVIAVLMMRAFGR